MPLCPCSAQLQPHDPMPGVCPMTPAVNVSVITAEPGCDFGCCIEVTVLAPEDDPDVEHVGTYTETY